MITLECNDEGMEMRVEVEGVDELIRFLGKVREPNEWVQVHREKILEGGLVCISQ